VEKILFEDYAPSFDTAADQFPSGRKKLIHTQGVIAKGKWVLSGDKKYTGIFNGCENLLIRSSLAKQPDLTKKKADQALGNFVPGISLKCLRSGVSSANLMAMFNVTGQKSWNFFFNDFTHDFPAPNYDDMDFALKALAGRFSTLTPLTGTLGLKPLAEYDENGAKAEQPIYPFHLDFKPNPDLRSRFSNDFTQYFVDQLKTIDNGTVLYDIYAVESPGCPSTKIGHLELTTPFTTSKFADETLFFQHNWREGDLEGNHTDWDKYSDKVSFGIFSGLKFEKAQKAKCPFASLFN